MQAVGASDFPDIVEMKHKVQEMAKVRYATLSQPELQYIKEKVTSVCDGYYGGFLDDAQKKKMPKDGHGRQHVTRWT